LIDEILKKKPDLRNTTAKMLKGKTPTSPFKKSPPKRTGSSTDKIELSPSPPPLKGIVKGGSDKNSTFQKSGSL